jgi:nicotinate dehydrogenase subunit B
VTLATSKRDLLRRTGALLVLRGAHSGDLSEEPEAASPEPGSPEPELFLALTDDGQVAAFCGHVDLGTGIRTALAQIVAEELDVPVERVALVLGSTGDAPNQGATIASETIQVTAIPLRCAAATARRTLLQHAALVLDAGLDNLVVADGVVRVREGNHFVSYAELIQGQHLRIALDENAPIKPVEAYGVVGRPVARVDIPDKASGAFTYVHDVRVPGMLHGRVVRPPYAGRDAGPFVGDSLLWVDEGSVAHVPGVVAIVVVRDFVGIVAEREEWAIAATSALKLRWREAPPLPDLGPPEEALRANPSSPRTLLDRGDVEGALAGAATRLDRTYLWPYQMHGSIGPSCSVADYRDDGLVVWSGTQNPHMLRADLARLLDLPEAAIEIRRHEAAGCYGRNGADDVGADAALLSRAVRRPVRVQLSREDEHLWEPKGAAQVMDVRGGLDGHGGVAAYDFATRFPSNGAPTLALLLTGKEKPVPAVFEMGDRTSVPPYAYANARVTVHDMAPIVRASWFRGVSALPNSFAHESWIDECAAEAGIDPVAYRLRHLEDERAESLIGAVAARAEWRPRTGPGSEGREGDVLFGRGFAYASYVHGKFPGVAAASSAWVADVAVDRRTGAVAVTRVVVGQDNGLSINPAGVRHQIHGNVVQSTSRALMEEVRFDAAGAAAREWGAYPILAFPDLPAIDVVVMERPHAPPLGAGESASVPSAAAIANAIYDATGVRFREVPFTPDRIRAGLAAAGMLPRPAEPVSAGEAPRARGGGAAFRPASGRWRRPGGFLAAALTGAVGMAAAILPWRPAYAPIARPDPSLYAASAIERGRLVAAVGGCVTCHSGPGGRLAGGLALDTAFGRVWSTNISPDPEHGIGTWSYPAFERAMRNGISWDGRHLYPAHPYPSFAKASEADLQALYAYLMSETPVASTPPRTELAFPYNLRPVMAVWNALFLRPGAFAPDPARSAEWNRGAYLVEALGHCGACHTPRNALGAERGGAAHLGGAVAGGWEAPALSSLSRSPVPWTADALYAYLRTGFSPVHGVAAGPMAPVVAELGALPDSDIRAMANYLAALADAPAGLDEAAFARSLQEASRTRIGTGEGARLYEGACAVCHEPGRGPQLWGVKPSLALNTNLFSARPDNLVRTILQGVSNPPRPELGYMPAFGASLDDRQVATLVAHLRARFAPNEPAWTGLTETVARLRADPR